jgi:hypothetical protein
MLYAGTGAIKTGPNPKSGPYLQRNPNRGRIKLRWRVHSTIRKTGCRRKTPGPLHITSTTEESVMTGSSWGNMPSGKREFKRRGK